MKYTKIITTALFFASTQYSPITHAAQQRDFSPAPSPDGKSFVYYSYRNDELPDLYINTLDGKEKQITATPDTWEIEPDWSSDGKYIAYAAGASMADLEIFIAAPDGSHAHQITDDNLINSGPNFSPSGDSVAFNRLDRENNHSQIITIDLKTGKETIVFNDPKISGFKPKYSPDGKTIAFMGKHKDKEKGELFLIQSDGSHFKKIEINEVSVGILNWANKKTLLLTGAKEGKTNQLFSLLIANGSYQQLTNYESEHVYFANSIDNGNTVFIDKGDWSSNFFIYKGNFEKHQLNIERLSGHHFLNDQQAKLQDYLAPFVGKWRGVSTEGRTKNRFSEETIYAWGPNKTSLDVTMKYFWDSKLMGSARGYMALDRDADKAYFNLVMQDGTVVMQEQTNSGNATKFEMNAKSSGDGKAFPHEFKTELVKIDKNSWKSHVFRNIDGDWQRTSVHEFSRVQ